MHKQPTHGRRVLARLGELVRRRPRGGLGCNCRRAGRRGGRLRRRQERRLGRAVGHFERPSEGLDLRPQLLDLLAQLSHDHFVRIGVEPTQEFELLVHLLQPRVRCDGADAASRGDAACTQG